MISKPVNQPAVSVLMALYNKASYVGLAIESILAQDFTDYELLICDDGSTDDSLAIAEHHAAKDKRIRTIRNQRNQGYAFTMNRLMDNATGDLLAIMDADDISLHGRLSKQFGYLRDSPQVSMVGTWAEYIDEGANLVDSLAFRPQFTVDRSIKEHCFFRDLLLFGTLMFRAVLVSAHKLRLNEKIVSGQDDDFMIRSLKFTKVGVIPRVLYHYRRHCDQHHQRASSIARLESGYRSMVTMLANCGVTTSVETVAVLLHHQWGGVSANQLRAAQVGEVRNLAVAITHIRRVCEYRYRRTPRHIAEPFMRSYFRFIRAKYSGRPGVFGIFKVGYHLTYELLLFSIANPRFCMGYMLRNIWRRLRVVLQRLGVVRR